MGVYNSKANILNFVMVQKFFLYFEDILSYNFLNKNRVFFYYIKKYHFFISFQKNIFFVKSSSCVDNFAKSFWKNLSPLIMFWDCELHPNFQTKKILHFLFKIWIKLKKFTILKTMTYWDHYIINEHIFFQKLFCKIINETRTFQKIFFWNKMKKWYFLIW